jgi:outer membrane protein
MKTQLKFVAIAALSLAAQGAFAQSAGAIMVRAGYGTIAPQVSSGDLSAPSIAGSKTYVGSASNLIGGITYMYTDNISFDLPLALPFKHKIYGDGSVAGVGQIGDTLALPFTLMAQYRFLDAKAQFRPYVGLGATYAYFFNEVGSGALTAMTNPGGPPTTLKIDGQFTVTAQVGGTYAIDSHWFVDGFYNYTPLKTKTTLSTGQSVDVTLDPQSYGLAVGYKF